MMRLTELKLAFNVKSPVLALGSHTKNTVCFIFGNTAYLSPVHHDLSEPKDFMQFKKTVNFFLKKNPSVIAYDLHPEYQSSKYAYELRAGNRKLIAIQHHHAHIASCMAENGRKNQKIIGVAFDGTGMGSDGRVWGAEFLTCDYKNFIGRSHLKEIPLLGGEQAISEPWRLAVAWLYQAYGDRFLKSKSGFVKNINRDNWKILRQMYFSGFNSPLASSMGRLFDAAASLILGKSRAGFEAELAIRLEKAAGDFKTQPHPYAFHIFREGAGYVIDPLTTFRQIMTDLNAGKSKQEMASRFHFTVARMICEVCALLRKSSKINIVALSGGVFQNNLLLGMALDLLYKSGFEVVFHKKLSCNDSGVSLGQAVIANFS